MVSNDIDYRLSSDDFSILDFIDCITKHHEPGDRLQWGLEQHLGIDLSLYYFFSVNRQNVDKKVIPGKAYVNGIEVEQVKGLERGEYLIKKELVKEPLIIDIECVPAYKITFLDLKYCDHLALEGENTVVGITDYRFSTMYSRNEKPGFIFYKAGTEEEVEVEEFEFTNNPSYPWMRFKMPPYDLDVKVIAKKDDKIGVLTIDESSIKDIEYSSLEGYNTYCSGIVSEALYSDDYDIGIEDHYFYERSIHFKRGTDLKVIVYLLEKRKLLCSLNGINYVPVKVSKEEIRGNDDKLVIVYEYLFKPVRFKKTGTLSFIVK